MKISVVCAHAPHLNTGMLSVDLSAHDFFKNLEVELGVNIDVVLYNAEADFFLDDGLVYYEIVDVEEVISNSDAVFYWGDFLHSYQYLEAVSKRYAKENELSFKDAKDIMYKRLLLEGVEDSLLEKCFSFGTALHTNGMEEERDERYVYGLSRLLSKMPLVMFRDSVSIFYAGLFGKGSNILPIGCDAAFYLDNKRCFHKGGDKIGYSFGRTFVNERHLLSSGKGLVDILANSLCLKEKVSLEWLKSNKQFPVHFLHEKLHNISQCKLVVTDTYHCAINALRLGVPVVCIGKASDRKKKSTLNEKKKEWLFYQNNLQDYYVYSEDFSKIEDFKLTQKRLLNAIERGEENFEFFKERLFLKKNKIQECFANKLREIRDKSTAIDDRLPRRKKNNLIITECIFCDNEKDKGVLDKYLERIFFTIKSVRQQQLIEGFEHVLIIYISSDKIDQIKRMKNYIESLKFSGDNQCRLVVYDHPNAGYGFNDLAHIDKLKNPNKMSGFRDKLFRLSGVGRYVHNRDIVIRLAIDDDDLMPKWHLKNVITVTEGLIKEKGVGVYGIGFLTTLIAYANQEDSFDVDRVGLSLSICGNKFWILPSSVDINIYSPWMIPDDMDSDISNAFKEEFKASLFYYNNDFPGILYMRWGGNLSSFSKRHFYRNTYESFSDLGVDNLLDGNFLNLSHDYCYRNDNLVVPKSYFKADARILEDRRIKCQTNLWTYCPSGYLAFYLYKNGVVVLKTKYEKNDSCEFDIEAEVGDVYVVKVFLKVKGEVVETIKTKKAYA